MIVVYYFTGKEHDIVPEPHGYSKVKKNGFTAVMKSPMKSVADQAKSVSKREAINLHVQAHGRRAEVSLDNMATVNQVQQSLSNISKHKITFTFLEVTYWCDENKSLCLFISLKLFTFI